MATDKNQKKAELEAWQAENARRLAQERKEDNVEYRHLEKAANRLGWIGWWIFVLGLLSSGVTCAGAANNNRDATIGIGFGIFVVSAAVGFFLIAVEYGLLALRDIAINSGSPHCRDQNDR